MTNAEARQLTRCPACGFDVMHVPSTGLVSCLSSVEYGNCSWHFRGTPYKHDQIRHRKTVKEKKLEQLENRIRKLKEESEKG